MYTDMHIQTYSHIDTQHNTLLHEYMNTVKFKILAWNYYW